VTGRVAHPLEIGCQAVDTAHDRESNMGIRLRQLAKTLAVAGVVAAVPQISAHAENNERWGGRQAWQGYSWHNGGYGGYGGNYDGGGVSFSMAASRATTTRLPRFTTIRRLNAITLRRSLTIPRRQTITALNSGCSSVFHFAEPVAGGCAAVTPNSRDAASRGARGAEPIAPAGLDWLAVNAEISQHE